MNDSRILADGVSICNDTHQTHLNNNDLIIGPTGAGKTRGYVIPNIIHNSGESLLIVDTKGNLHKTYGSYLRSQGYVTQVVDFVDCLQSECGYDPLDHIGPGEGASAYNQQDVLRLAAALCPVESQREPYWEQAAQMSLSSLVALTLERFVPEDRNMRTVSHLSMQLGEELMDELFDDLSVSDLTSFAVQLYKRATVNKNADKMVASVMGIVVNALQPLSFDGATHLFTHEKRVDFSRLGHEKTALFVTVSDNDRSLDRLVNLFYTQAFQELIREADQQPDSCLPVPVRIVLDDFATNAVIPDFDKVISTIRSRNICVSLIVQDLTQLAGLYGEAKGTVISSNCDTWLYLGGQDVNTAEHLSKKLGRTVDSVLSLSVDEAYLFQRGGRTRRVSTYDLEADQAYRALMSRKKAATQPSQAKEAEECQAA